MITIRNAVLTPVVVGFLFSTIAIARPVAPAKIELPPTDIEIAEEKDGWGKVVNGIQIGLGYDTPKRPYHQGEHVSFKLFARNNSNKIINLVHYGLLGPLPTILDSHGDPMQINQLPFDRPVQIYNLSLSPGEVKEVGTQYVQLDSDPQGKPGRKDPNPYCYITPGKYQIQQIFTFIKDPKANYHGQLTTGKLELEILPNEKAKAPNTAKSWGKPVEGVQIKVNPSQQTLFDDKIPKFTMDIQNKGTVEWKLVLAWEHWEVELDGLWHKAGCAFSGDVPTLTLAPGQEHKAIAFSPNERSAWNNNGKAMEPTPGWHTIRLAFYGISEKDNEKFRRIRVVSNPVQIEVFPIEGKTYPKPSNALNEEIYQILKMRAKGLAKAEAFGNSLLKKYTTRQQKALINCQIAENYAQSGQVSPSKTIEYAKKAWWYLDDPIKRAQLFVYWGDAVQLSKSRKEATKVYLRGLAFCLKYNLPTKEPELPTFNRVRYSGPPEEAEKIRSESNRQMAARNHAKLTGNLIQHRQALTGQIIQLYAKSPDAFDELHQLAMHYLASQPAAQQLITAAKAYRTNHKTPFPVITKNFRAPKPKPDSSWDKTIGGAQVRL